MSAQPSDVEKSCRNGLRETKVHCAPDFVLQRQPLFNSGLRQPAPYNTQIGIEFLALPNDVVDWPAVVDFQPLLSGHLQLA